MFIIFDLDGTLRDLTHRLHFIKNGNRDYDSFFAACDKDEPIWETIEVLVDHVNSGRHRVEIWSGASDACMGKTKVWLDKYITPKLNGVKASELIKHMRESGDHTRDEILKENWLKQEPVYPDIVYDDRARVVFMWRKNGIRCLQVAKGDFDNKFNRPRKPTLNIMVGPSSSGKTSFIEGNPDKFAFCKIVSSDNIRSKQFPCEDKFCSDHAYTREGLASTHGAVRLIAEQYLKCGIDVTIDSTNIKRKDRVSLVNYLYNLVDDINYYIIDRPLSIKILDKTCHTSEEIIKKHHQTFQASQKYALQGDGLDKVKVHDHRYIQTNK